MIDINIYKYLHLSINLFNNETHKKYLLKLNYAQICIIGWMLLSVMADPAMFCSLQL